MTDTAEQVIKDIANANPLGLIDYEADWSEVTPGDGPIKGCVFCRCSEWQVETGEHVSACVWLRSRKLIGAPAVKL